MCFPTNRHINKPLNFWVSELRTSSSGCWWTLPKGHWVESKPCRGQQLPCSGTHTSGRSCAGCPSSCGQKNWTPRRAGKPARPSPKCRTWPQFWLQQVAASLHTCLSLWTWRWDVSGHLHPSYQVQKIWVLKPGLQLKLQPANLTSVFPLCLSQNLVLFGI